MQICQLVVSQCFGGEQIECAGGRVVEQGVEDGQIVGQRLAGGGGGGQDNVFPRQRCLDRLGLVGVGLLDAGVAGGCDQARVESGRPGSDAGGSGRDALPGGHAAHKGWILSEGAQSVG